MGVLLVGPEASAPSLSATFPRNWNQVISSARWHRLPQPPACRPRPYTLGGLTSSPGQSKECEEVGGGDQSQLHVTSQCCEGCLVPGCSQVPVRGQGACHPPPSSSLESSSSQPLTCGVPTVLFLLSLGRAGAVGRGILLTNAVLGFPSDMGSSGAILGKVGQLSPAPRPSIISLSSAAIQKTTALPVGAKGHFSLSWLFPG